MVSIFSFLAMGFSLLACLVFPIVLCIVFMKKSRPGGLPLLMGIAVFIVFVLILEQIMHFVFLSAIPSTKDFFANSTLFYVLYGALAAGIFEEGGRWLAFTFFLKKKREWKHGVTYGIGHGGIEAIIIAAPVVINNLIYSVLINTGSFDALIKMSPASTAGLLEDARDALISTSSWMLALTGVERIFTFIIQIALSILVCYAVYKRKYLLVGLAVLIHATVDVPAVLYQRGVLPIWIVETYIAVFATFALIFIFKSRTLFSTVHTGVDSSALENPATPVVE